MSTLLQTELAESLDDFIRNEIEELGLRDEREYLERLAKAEQKKKIQAYFDAKILEALEDDVWYTMEDDWLEKKIAEMDRRIEARKTKKVQ